MTLPDNILETIFHLAAGLDNSLALYNAMVTRRYYSQDAKDVLTEMCKSVIALKGYAQMAKDDNRAELVESVQGSISEIVQKLKSLSSDPRVPWWNIPNAAGMTKDQLLTEILHRCADFQALQDDYTGVPLLSRQRRRSNALSPSFVDDM